MSDHNHTGNCWHSDVTYSCTECGKGVLCDVCHEHCEPRGECEECPACAACDEEGES